MKSKILSLMFVLGILALQADGKAKEEALETEMTSEQVKSLEISSNEIFKKICEVLPGSCQDACKTRDPHGLSCCINENLDKIPSSVKSLGGTFCDNACGRISCAASKTVANACGIICCSTKWGSVTNCLKKVNKTCDDFNCPPPSPAKK